MFRFLATFFLLPLPLLWTCVWAVHQGIASARDEHHRITPQSPWHYFDAVLRQNRLHIWAAVCWLVTAQALLLLSRHSIFLWKNEPRIALWYFTDAFCRQLILPAFGIAICVLAAPRFRSFSSLLSASYFVGAILAALSGPLPYWTKNFGWFFAQKFLFHELHYFNEADRTKVVIPIILTPELFAMVGLCCLTVSIIRVRFFVGERWFLQEDI